MILPVVCKEISDLRVPFFDANKIKQIENIRVRTIPSFLRKSGTKFAFYRTGRFMEKIKSTKTHVFGCICNPGKRNVQRKRERLSILTGGDAKQNELMPFKRNEDAIKTG